MQYIHIQKGMETPIPRMELQFQTKTKQNITKQNNFVVMSLLDYVRG